MGCQFSIALHVSHLVRAERVANVFVDVRSHIDAPAAAAVVVAVHLAWTTEVAEENLGVEDVETVVLMRVEDCCCGGCTATEYPS